MSRTLPGIGNVAPEDLALSAPRAKVVANAFGWCPDPDCGADVVKGEPHDKECKLAKGGSK